MVYSFLPSSKYVWNGLKLRNCEFDSFFFPVCLGHQVEFEITFYAGISMDRYGSTTYEQQPVRWLHRTQGLRGGLYAGATVQTTLNVDDYMQDLQSIAKCRIMIRDCDKHQSDRHDHRYAVNIHVCESYSQSYHF